MFFINPDYNTKNNENEIIRFFVVSDYLSAAPAYANFLKNMPVGVRGLEPRTPASQTRCAANCATPRI